MNNSDKRIHELGREALDAVTDALPADSVRRLNAARQQALLPQRPLSRPWRFVAAAAVLVLALSIGILMRPGEQAAVAPPVADADLYQDLEFYLWLAQELESPSDSAS